ncbi:hypothetical protein NPIL_594041 [Nephila pilipes]|uniref:Uncharacterized protein n=1 Tax=Nephila pilipes TaxID=299642 RepID=A0A8X6TY41_NEPPI|nr:hypothetical protein NPIL_594041 [Nephila pilipes]
MDVRYIVALLCITVVMAANPSTDDLQLVMKCVAKSADGKICDEFSSCFNLFPQPVNNSIKQCIEKVSGGDGMCSRNGELYESEENRKKVSDCVSGGIPEGLTEEQTEQMGKTVDCFMTVVCNQELCDELVKCFDFFPLPYKDVIHRCINRIPGGVGKCSEDEQLFNSKLHRKQLFQCFTDQAPVELSEAERAQMDKYRV